LEQPGHRRVGGAQVDRLAVYLHGEAVVAPQHDAALRRRVVGGPPLRRQLVRSGRAGVGALVVLYVEREGGRGHQLPQTLPKPGQVLAERGRVVRARQVGAEAALGSGGSLEKLEQRQAGGTLDPEGYVQ
jgi:hypothetical protein